MKILLAEDDPVARRLVELALSQDGYEPVHVADGRAAWEALQDDTGPKLAILDWVMPEMDGLEVCRKLRELKGRPYVYVLLLTSKGEREDVVAGMDAGADDYLTKPFEPQELLVRLRAGRRILDLQEQLIAARQAVEYEATHDPLTGLWNRNAIIEFLKRELSRSKREGKPVGIGMADVDHFKQINDTFGHLMGDAVLRESAERFRAGLRVYDSIGRYGGEEFMIVMVGCDLQTAESVAERLRSEVCRAPIRASGAEVPITISIGVTAVNQIQHLDEEPLIKAADDALYEAKRAGRNCVVARPFLGT